MVNKKQDLNKIKNILVTGSEGYIGSILVPMLLCEGYNVTGCDSGFFEKGNLTKTSFPKYQLIRNDIRDLEEKALVGFDGIISLAAMCNDTLGEMLEDMTYEINYLATVRLADLARNAGVKRFIFSSSCSLYGEGREKKLTEEDNPNPITAYAKSKIFAEKELSKLTDVNFSPVLMRNATAHGISPRMRFNIVANNLTGCAMTRNIINILGDGTPWRPMVHVSDICGAMIKVLKAKKKNIHNQIFNVGDVKENYQIKEIAERVKEQFQDCKIKIAQKKSSDTRNYIVSFTKLKEHLGYNCKTSLNGGIKEMRETFKYINLSKKDFENPIYSRLAQMKYLLDNKLINHDLRWI